MRGFQEVQSAFRKQRYNASQMLSKNQNPAENFLPKNQTIDRIHQSAKFQITRKNQKLVFRNGPFELKRLNQTSQQRSQTRQKSQNMTDNAIFGSTFSDFRKSNLPVIQIEKHKISPKQLASLRLKGDIQVEINKVFDKGELLANSQKFKKVKRNQINYFHKNLNNDKDWDQEVKKIMSIKVQKDKNFQLQKFLMENQNIDYSPINVGQKENDDKKDNPLRFADIDNDDKNKKQ